MTTIHLNTTGQYSGAFIPPVGWTNLLNNFAHTAYTAGGIRTTGGASAALTYDTIISDIQTINCELQLHGLIGPSQPGLCFLNASITGIKAIIGDTSIEVKSTVSNAGDVVLSSVSITNDANDRFGFKYISTSGDYVVLKNDLPVLFGNYADYLTNTNLKAGIYNYNDGSSPTFTEVTVTNESPVLYDLDFTAMIDASTYAPTGKWISVGTGDARILNGRITNKDASQTTTAILVHDKVNSGPLRSTIKMGVVSGSDSVGIAFCDDNGTGYVLLVRSTDMRLFTCVNGAVVTMIDNYGYTTATDDEITVSFDPITGIFNTYFNDLHIRYKLDTTYSTGLRAGFTVRAHTDASIKSVSINGLGGIYPVSTTEFTGFTNDIVGTIAVQAGDIVELNAQYSHSNGALFAPTGNGESFIEVAPRVEVRGYYYHRFYLPVTASGTLVINGPDSPQWSHQNWTGTVWRSRYPINVNKSSFKAQTYDGDGAWVVPSLSNTITAGQVVSSVFTTCDWDSSFGTGVNIFKEVSPSVPLIFAENTEVVSIGFLQASYITEPGTVVTSLTRTGTHTPSYHMSTFVLEEQVSTIVVNGGLPILPDQTVVPVVATGLLGIPLSITNTNAGLPVTNITGTATEFSFNVPARTDGALYPKNGTSVDFTFTNGAEINLVTVPFDVAVPSAMHTVSGPILDDPTYLFGAILAQTGRTAINGDVFSYTVPAEMADLVIDTSGQITTTNPGVFSTWLYVNQGADIGKWYNYNVTVSSGSMVDVTPTSFAFTDVTNAATSSLIESNVITVAGVDAEEDIAVSITGGEYAVNTGSGYGAWTTADTDVRLGYLIKVRRTSSAVASTAVNVLLTIGGVSDTFTITTAGAVDSTPDAYSYTSVSNAQLSSVVTSAAVAIVGFSGSTAISITNGSYSINGGAFTTTDGTVSVGQTVAVRVTTSGSELTPTIATLNIGGVTGTFTATTRAYDTTPNAFSFTALANTAISTLATSGSITVAGIDTGASSPISITGGQYSINGGTYTAANGTVSVGQSVTVRLTTSGTYSTAANATLNIGGTTAIFTATTRAADTAPTAFSFTSVTGATLSTLTESGSITVSGVDSAVNVSISITNGEYSFYNGAVWSSWTSSNGNVQLGNLVKVRNTSSGIDGQSVVTTLTIGGVSSTFTVSTGVVDLTPDAFSFTSSLNNEVSTLVTSNAVTIAGISNGYDTAINITNGQYRIHDGSSWSGFVTGLGNVRLGYQIQVRHSTASSYNTSNVTTISVGGTSSTFTSTTRVANTLPNAFTLGTVVNVGLNSIYESSAITVSGVDAGVSIPLAVTNGEYSINSGAWSTSNTNVLLGMNVKVRRTSSAAYSTASTVSLDIGGRVDVFSITTRAADITPNAISFTPSAGVPVNDAVVSNAVTIIGMDPNIDVAFTVTNGEASIHNGVVWSNFNTTGVIRTGYQVRLRTTAPTTVDQSKTVTFTVGTVSGVWGVDTNSSIVTIDPITFNDISNASIRSTFDSNLVMLSGMTPGSLITVNISGGAYRAFYRNMATAWLTGSTQLPFGCEIRVRLTTSDNYSTQHNAVLTIGSYSTSFRVVTKAPNITPRIFNFNTIKNAVKSESYESTTAIIKGFDVGVAANVSITNGEYKIDTGTGFGDWSAAPTTVETGAVVKVRTTSPSTAETTKLTTLTVNGVTGTFTLITRKDPVATTSDDIIGDFSITPVVNAEPNTRIESSVFTVTDIDSNITIPVSVANGEYSVNGQSFTAMAGSVKLGDSIKVAGRSKSGYNALNEVTVSLGSLTRTFTITTRAEKTVVAPVSFYGVVDAPINTAIESNEVIISGVDASFPVTLSTSGGLSYRINKGLGYESLTAADGVVNAGDRVQVVVVSSGQYSTLRIGTLVVNGNNIQFRVTSAPAPVLSVFSSIARKVTTRRYRLTK